MTQAATETETVPETPALEAGPIPTSTVEVEGLGTVGEDQLDSLTKDWLKKVLRALDAVPPRSASADDLRTLARNGLRLRAMVAAADAAGTDPETETVDAGDNPDVVNALVAPTEEERGLIPNGSQFTQIVAMAEYLAKSNLTPDALRGKPNDVGAVLLRAWDLGISQSAALESLYVIKGKVGMEGKLMAALIRRAGHSLRVVESDGQHAVWYGRRVDNGDDGYGEFSLDDAKQAGLIRGINQDGSVDPHSDKLTWQKYTKAMLKWRALAILARDLFSDCIAGVSYLPEELGYIDVDEVSPGGGGKSADEQTMTLNQQRSELAARIAELPEDLRVELREVWKSRNLPKPDDLRPGAMRTARGLIEDAEKKARERVEAAQADVDEAELVDDEGATAPESGESTGPEGVPGGETDHPVDPSGDAPAADDVDDADLVEYCVGCNEPIPDDANPVYDDEERPWHPECAPWV